MSPLCFFLAASALGATDPAAAHGHRFALFIGDPEGGAGTRALHYAARDAQRLDDILTRLGGVQPGDDLVLIGQRANDVRRAFGDLADRSRAARARGEPTLLLVYYSGHAKDGELRLRDTRLPLDDLRQLLSDAPADVRIGLIDSCQSGIITRGKGVKPVPAFDVQSDFGAGGGAAPKGLVLIASSSADEESQEADAVDGSFFTHYLASGLLGDADANGDGRVTLAEAYAYTFGHTVGSTIDTRAGPQHPVYLYDLGGSGDLVLTDLNSVRGGLRFAAEGEGDYVILDATRKAVAEVAKVAGSERRLALAPGTYTLKKPVGDELWVGKITVGDALVTVDDASLRRVALEDDPQKGVAGTVVTLSGSLGYQGFFAAASDSGLFPAQGLGGAELGLREYLGHALGVGFDLAFGGGQTTLTFPGLAPIGASVQELSGGASLFRDFEPFPWLRLSPGVRLAFLFLAREFPKNAELANQGFFTFTPGAELTATVPLPFLGGLEAFARARLNYLFYNIDNDQSLGYVDASLGVAYVFGN